MLITGVIITALTLGSGSVHANALENTALDLSTLYPTPTITVERDLPSEPAAEPSPPLKYTVMPGDSLSSIAAEQNTTWTRLWYKNIELTNPDLILPGQVFLIPAADESLLMRSIPKPVVLKSAQETLRSRVVSGNTYDPGACTWYVKNMRPDLPNDLGNANTWYERAAAQGYEVGSTPRVGAVGTTTAGELGHVVYVEAVNGDTITMSEMNYAGLYSQRTRTVPASRFSYIY